MSSPNRDPAKITKMAEIRMPIRPLNSFLEEQPSSPSSSDIDSCAENEREREWGGMQVGEGGRARGERSVFRWLQVR